MNLKNNVHGRRYKETSCTSTITECMHSWADSLQINLFSYMGTLITSDAKRTWNKAKNCRGKKQHFITICEESAHMQLYRYTTVLRWWRILKHYIWSVLLRDCESWSISNNIVERLEAAEIMVFVNYEYIVPSKPQIRKFWVKWR